MIKPTFISILVPVPVFVNLSNDTEQLDRYLEKGSDKGEADTGGN